MNNYIIYIFPKAGLMQQYLPSIASESIAIAFAPENVEQIMVHGASALSRAWELLRTGKTVEEVQEMICGYCGSFWDEHTIEAKAAHLKGEPVKIERLES